MNKNNLSIMMRESNIKHYTNILFILAHIFADSKINIYIVYVYSNKIINLDGKEDQKLIMKSFHDNVLGGHLFVYTRRNRYNQKAVLLEKYE